MQQPETWCSADTEGLAADKTVACDISIAGAVQSPVHRSTSERTEALVADMRQPPTSVPLYLQGSAADQADSDKISISQLKHLRTY
jgi:hypothetical protein